MTDKPTQTDAELQSIIDDADAGPPTDNEWLCLECGRWTPWRHEEAHDHADGCKAPAIYAARRDWKARLNDYMAKRGRQATQDVVGEVVWADGVPNSIREVHLKDLPAGTKLYTSPQPAHSGEPYGCVTTHRGTGQRFFYRHPEPPYLDSASECVTVYTAPPPVEREPLTDEQIDQAIAELGLNYLADAHATNRAVLRKLCRHANGIT